MTARSDNRREDLGGCPQRPQGQATGPEATTDPMATEYLRQPRRQTLDPEVAASVLRAKLRTGKSWRWLAKRLGLSHSHLLQISQGVRCPSKTVALAMRPLPFEEGEWDALYEAAVVGRGRDRPH
jgi:hypothetical protein